jgi:RNA polymerase sigma-70 factor, ECF subfamily
MMANNEEYLEKNDEELVGLAKREKENYRFLMQRYQERLKRYIIRLSGASQEDAQDILQNVFIKAYQNLNDFDTNLKFSSWIYRITHNEAVTFLRRKDTRPRTVNPQDSSVIINLIKSDSDITGSLDKKFLAEKISGVINLLDKKYQDVVVLKYMEDKDYREISDILRKPPGTVATLLKRAKEQLKKKLEKNNIIG